MESELPRRHEAVVACVNSHGRALPPLRSTLDWSIIQDRASIEVYGIHHAAKALRDLTKTVAKWRKPGHTGLAVTTWDGDAKTRQELERLSAADAAGEAEVSD